MASDLKQLRRLADQWEKDAGQSYLDVAAAFRECALEMRQLVRQIEIERSQPERSGFVVRYADGVLEATTTLPLAGVECWPLS